MASFTLRRSRRARTSAANCAMVNTREATFLKVVSQLRTAVATQVGDDGADTSQVLDERTPILTIERRRMKKDYRQTRAGVVENKFRSVRFVSVVHTIGGYSPGIGIGSSGIPIHPAT